MTTWPYKHPFAELEKKEWPYNRTNAEEDLLQKSYFFDQKILKLFLAKKKEWPCNRTNAEEDLLNKWGFDQKKLPIHKAIYKANSQGFDENFWVAFLSANFPWYWFWQSESLFFDKRLALSL